MKFSKKYLQWLSICGNKSSIPPDFYMDQSNYSFFPPDFAIQQNEEEIMSFINTLRQKNVKNILEIGLGYYGSTHVLFREYFDSVVTVELSLERVKSFFYRAESFFGSNFFSEGKSQVLVADSNSASAPKKIVKALERNKLVTFDAIFIDGFHGFDTVLLDFLIYNNFVKKSGIVAFHDVISEIEDSGVPKLIRDLRFGHLKHLVTDYSEIIHSKYLGIGYFTKV